MGFAATAGDTVPGWGNHAQPVLAEVAPVWGAGSVGLGELASPTPLGCSAGLILRWPGFG